MDLEPVKIMIWAEIIIHHQLMAVANHRVGVEMVRVTDQYMNLHHHVQPIVVLLTMFHHLTEAKIIIHHQVTAEVIITHHQKVTCHVHQKGVCQCQEVNTLRIRG